MGVSEAKALVIGAGPSGLAVAACLKRTSVPFDLIDRRGVTGGAYRQIHRGIVLASPTRYTVLPGLPDESGNEYITVPEYEAYLERYARLHALVPEKAEVERIERAGESFLVRLKDRPDPVTYGAIVAATGFYDHPLSPAIAGLDPAGARPRVLHAHDWRGAESLVGQRVLVIGGATAAVEIATECARARIAVSVSARGKGVSVMAQRFLGRDIHDFLFLYDLLPGFLVRGYCERRPTLPGTDLGWTELVREGAITVRGAVRSFEGTRALFDKGEPQDFDAVVLATGYSFAFPYLPPEVDRAPAPSLHPLARKGESRSVPGIFLVGTPCARTVASEFLRGINDDAPVIAGLVKERLRSHARQ